MRSVVAGVVGIEPRVGDDVGEATVLLTVAVRIRSRRDVGIACELHVDGQSHYHWLKPKPMTGDFRVAVLKVTK